MHKSGDEDKKPRRAMLKDISIGEVSFVGRGANQGARQSLYKIADPEDLSKRLFSEVMQDVQGSEAASALLEEMLEGTGYLRHSLVEIMEDPRIDQRKSLLRESIQQFSAAMASMIDSAELTKALQKIAGKTEDGKVFPASDYAFIPDKEKPSTWKLRLTSMPGGKPDPHIVGAAVAALGPGFRGQKVQLPSEARAGVVRRVRSAWLQANPNKGKDDLPAVLKSLEKEDETMSTELEKLQKKFDEQSALLTKTQFIAGLSDAEKTHYNSLDDSGKEAFEKMDAKTRQTMLKEALDKKAANEETFEMEGTVVKKSEVGPGMFAILKAQQARLDNAEKMADKLVKEAATRVLEDEAEAMLPHLAGTRAEKGLMLKGIRALPADLQEKQIAMLKAADAAMAKSFEEEGQGGKVDPSSAGEKLNKMAADKAEKDGIPFAKAYDAVLKTTEGANLYAESLKK
jgi:hypothetical protein